jgi:hypothetical protein
MPMSGGWPAVLVFFCWAPVRVIVLLACLLTLEPPRPDREPSGRAYSRTYPSASGGSITPVVTRVSSGPTYPMPV